MIPTKAKNRKQLAKERMHQANRVIGPAMDDVGRKMGLLKISMDSMNAKLLELRESTKEYERFRKDGGA